MPALIQRLRADCERLGLRLVQMAGMLGLTLADLPGSQAELARTIGAAVG